MEPSSQPLPKPIIQAEEDQEEKIPPQAHRVEPSSPDGGEDGLSLTSDPWETVPITRYALPTKVVNSKAFACTGPQYFVHHMLNSSGSEADSDHKVLPGIGDDEFEHMMKDFNPDEASDKPDKEPEEAPVEPDELECHEDAE